MLAKPKKVQVGSATRVSLEFSGLLLWFLCCFFFHTELSKTVETDDNHKQYKGYQSKAAMVVPV